MKMKEVAILIITFILSHIAFSQKEKLTRVVAGFPVNYEEDSVGTYVLPDLFTMKNGDTVKDAKTWMEKRRPEIVKLFEENQFGKMPSRPSEMHFDVFDKGTSVLNGKAIRKQVRVYFTKDTSYKMDLLIYLPSSTNKPSPLLLIINFFANSSVVDDPGVRPGEVWNREGKKVPASTAPLYGGRYSLYILTRLMSVVL